MTGVMAAAMASGSDGRRCGGDGPRRCGWDEHQAGHDEHGDGGELEEHERGLGVGAAADAEAVDEGEDGQRERGQEPVGHADVPVSSTV